MVGDWIFNKVQDLGEPGIGRDQIGRGLVPGGVLTLPGTGLRVGN